MTRALMSLSLSGWFAVVGCLWLVGRAARTVASDVRGWWHGWLASSDAGWADERRQLAELDRLQRIGVFAPRPYRHDPSPQPPPNQPSTQTKGTIR